MDAHGNKKNLGAKKTPQVGEKISGRRPRSSIEAVMLARFGGRSRGCIRCENEGGDWSKAPEACRESGHVYEGQE